MSIVINEPYKSNTTSCEDEAFSYFEVPPVDYTVTRRWKECIEPQFPITNDTRQLHFDIPASPNFVNLSETTLHVSLSIYKANGTALDAVAEGGFSGK